MITIRDYNKVAIITPDSEISYHDLIQNILVYAERLTPKEEKFKAVILSENREEWIYAFFAVWQKGGIAVPVDATSTASDIAYILNDCRPDFIFVSDAKASLAQEAVSKAGVEIETLPITKTKTKTSYGNENENKNKNKNKNENENENENKNKNEDENENENSNGAISDLTFGKVGSDIALLIYTSGTTGSPKGVMLSYENLEANIAGVADEVPIFNGERRTLILLPLHHVLPLMGTVIAPITRGCGVAICTSLSGPDIMAMLERGKIAIMVGVPRLWQTLYMGIMKKIDASPVTRALFNMCKKANNRKLSRFIFSAVHKKMGGHLDYCVCGGAALDSEIGYELKALGLEVLEGYGMTEMAPIIAFTRPGDYIPGCAGLPLPSVECKIVDGELLCKGKNLMAGYYNRPEETAEVIDKDGFLHTGDLARVDEKGRVYITGRSKEIIVLSNGKNVQPSEIEYKLEKYESQVKEAAVIQDGDLLRAIIVPQEEWIGSKTNAEAEEALKREVLEPYNLTVANYKKLMSVSVYRGELPRTRLEKLQRYKLKQLIEQPQGNATVEEKQAAPAADEKGGAFAVLKAYIEKEKKMPVTTESHLETDLAFDSLDKVNLQDFIEERFNITINADDMANYKNVGEMADFINENEYEYENGNENEDENENENGNENEDENEDRNKDRNNVSNSSLLTSRSSITLPKSAFTHPLIAKAFAGFCRMHNGLVVKGTENIPQKGPFILAPNHQSFLDGPLAMAGIKWGDIKNYYFYATEEHVQGSLRRWFAAHHNIILMERRNLKNSIVKMAEVLRAGKNIVIFPEGRRTNTGDLGTFKKTFAILSQELQVPILPVCIRGAYDALPRERTFPSTAHIEIEYLPPVNHDAAQTPEELAEIVKQRISDCGVKG